MRKKTDAKKNKILRAENSFGGQSLPAEPVRVATHRRGRAKPTTVSKPTEKPDTRACCQEAGVKNKR